MGGKNRQAQRRSINDFKGKSNMRTPYIPIPKQTDFKLTTLTDMFKTKAIINDPYKN